MACNLIRPKSFHAFFLTTSAHLLNHRSDSQITDPQSPQPLASVVVSVSRAVFWQHTNPQPSETNVGLWFISIVLQVQQQHPQRRRRRHFHPSNSLFLWLIFFFCCNGAPQNAAVTGRTANGMKIFCQRSRVCVFCTRPVRSRVRKLAKLLRIEAHHKYSSTLWPDFPWFGAAFRPYATLIVRSARCCRGSWQRGYRKLTVSFLFCALSLSLSQATMAGTEHGHDPKPGG